jgi:PIN domain nuclease of toxin-antitoxin system
VKLLLDTHVYLWVRLDDPKLPKHFRTAIADPANTKYISAISAAEIAVKRSVGKLVADVDLMEGLEGLGFDKLPFTHAHAQVLDSLPIKHRDPFDRMLIAQAIAEDLVFLSVDAQIADYGLPALPTP